MQALPGTMRRYMQNANSSVQLGKLTRCGYLSNTRKFVSKHPHLRFERYVTITTMHKSQNKETLRSRNA